MGLIDCRTPSESSTCEGCRSVAGVKQPGKLRVFKFQELERATKSFSEKNILGRGSHSCVYKGVLSGGEVVAVKRPAYGRRTAEDDIYFDNELGILSQLRHRHLVNLIGFCNEADEKLLVVEFMENGTLYDVLHSSSLEPLGWSARMHMALQAAEAILALHSASPPIIHRDVKSSNILIDRNWNAKLSDLGLALRGQLHDVARQRTPPAGTMGYIDPGYETPSRLSAKSDVFSFGILLLEIMSGRKAIDVRFNPSSLLDWAVPLIRDGNTLEVCDTALKPPSNLDVLHNLASIAACAVRPSSDRRPTMQEVVEALQRITKKLPSPRFGAKPLRVPRLAAPRVGAAEDSGPRIDMSPPTAVQTSELGRQDPSKNGLSFAKWDKLSVQYDGRVSGERNSVSVSDSDETSESRVYQNRRGRRLLDSDAGDGRFSTPESPFEIARGATSSKHESPIFDPNSGPTTIMGSLLRVDMIRNSAASPISSPLWCGSPGRSPLNSSVVDRNSPRRALESPTFGSKRPAGTLDSSRTSVTSGLSPQGPEYFQLRRSKSSASEFGLSGRRISNQSKGDVQLQSQGSLREGGSGGQSAPERRKKETGEAQLSPSSSKPHVQSQGSLREGRVGQVPPNRNSKDTRGAQQSSSSSEACVQSASQRSLAERNDQDNEETQQPSKSFEKLPLQENASAATQISKSHRDTKVDASGVSILQPTVPCRADVVVLIWDVPNPAVQFFSNAESHFEKVDLPIAV